MSAAIKLEIDLLERLLAGRSEARIVIVTKLLRQCATMRSSCYKIAIAVVGLCKVETSLILSRSKKNVSGT